MIIQGPEYYTVEEAAQLLRVSKPTIRRWIRAGSLRAERPGGRTLRIPREEVHRAAHAPDSRPARPRWDASPRSAAPPRVETRREAQYLSDSPLPLAEWMELTKSDLAEHHQGRGGQPFPPGRYGPHEMPMYLDEGWPPPLDVVIKELEQDHIEQMKKRGGKPFPSSLPLIHEAREDRDRGR